MEPLEWNLTAIERVDLYRKRNYFGKDTFPGSMIFNICWSLILNTRKALEYYKEKKKKKRK